MRNGLPGIGALLIVAVLTGAAYRFGMFFDEAFYRWEWPICLAGLLTVVFIGFGDWANGRAMRGAAIGVRSRDKRAADMRPALWGLLLAALLYGAAMLHEPASVLGSLKQALRYCTFAAYALMLHACFGTAARRGWLSAALQLSGFVVAGCALAGWMGALSFPDMILSTGDARLSAVGARLAGFVQYPNFMGAVAAAYMVWCWLLLVRAGTVRSFALTSAGAVPYLLVALLTESRGAWIAAAAAWLAGLALIGGKARCAWLLYGAWTLVCGGIAYRVVSGAGLRGAASGFVGRADAAETLLLALIVCAAPAGFTGLRWWIGRSRGRILPVASWAGWAAAVIGTALLLPPAIYGRLGGDGASYATAGARALFYRDAWKLFREAPLLGRGGDAWRSLFTQVQAQPYVGNEVHSGYLELLLDLGLVGLLAGAVVMAALLRPVWLRERTGLLPIGVLLLHAGIDFDMSFGYYWFLLLSWIVYYSGGGPVVAGSGRGAARGGEALPRGGRFAARARAAMMAAAALCFAAAAVLGWRLDAAVQHRETAAAVSGAARAAALRAALDANPYWTRIRIELAALAPPRERAALLAAGLRYEPQSVPLLWALGRAEAERGSVRGAAVWMRRALDLDRFDRGKQTEAVVAMAGLAQTMRAASRMEEAKLAADAADGFFAAYEALDRPYAANGRRFEVTEEAASAAERSRLLAVRPEAGPPLPGLPFSGRPAP